jgi:hypothetical protein
MTDRHTADSINDDDLDQLYADLARAQAEAARWGEAESADVAAGSYAGRVEELQATIDRLRTLATEDGELAIYISRERILAIIDGTPTGPAATGVARPTTWLTAGTRDLSIPEQHQFTVRPVDPELERAATARAVQAAQDHEHATAQLATLAAPPVPCPACARAGQAGVADNELHDACRDQEQPK